MPVRYVAFQYLADALADEPDGPDYAMPMTDVYVLLRLCLLKRDGCLLRMHADTARRLSAIVMAQYREAGAYVGVHAGVRYLDAPVVRAISENLATQSPISLADDVPGRVP